MTYFGPKVDTYVNLSLCQNSQIDYILVSKASDVANVYVSDPDLNYLDHLPLTAELSFTEISHTLHHQINLQNSHCINYSPAKL